MNEQPTRYKCYPVPAALRAEIWDRDRGVCHYCGKALHPFHDFHVDHVIPVVKGGETAANNLVASCRRCNISKGAQDPETARSRLKARLSIAPAGSQITPFPKIRVRTKAASDVKSGIGKRLADTRARRELTQLELAQKSNLSLASITRLENRTAYERPRVSTIKKLAEALSVPAHWLMFGGQDSDTESEAA